MVEPSPRAELVARLRSDQRRRWLAGERVLVESYAEDHPELRQNEEVLLDFIYGECCLREELKDAVRPDEYYSRFPQFSERLKGLFEVHEAMAAPQTDVQRADQHAVRRFPMRLNCPHCHNPIEVVADTPDDEILCPCCGSSFRLEPDRTQTWSKDKLPTLGKFELIEAIGRGAFGTVYRARDTQLKRMVAVKVPRSGRLATDEDEDRFVKEGRNAAQLQHAGIVPVYEVGRSETFPYIVSEYVEGITLADSLTGRKFGFREVAEMVRQVAVALQHAHDRGVVHRDLKPSNIILTPDGSPRVMDFGLAKRDAGEITVTVEGQVLGTPAYMSPEQASGQAHHVDGRSDVYSLGVILYELLTGELPFRGNQRMLLFQVLHDEPRQPRSLNDRIPRDLATICLKAMAKEPGRRYQSAQAIADDLGRWLRGEPIVARPVSRVERGWRWCRRNRTVAGLSAIAILALLSGTGVATYFAIEAAQEEKKATAEALCAEEGFREARQATATAEARAQTASSVSQFLITLFEEPTPYKLFATRLGSGEASVASRALLDRGAEQLVERLDDQPTIKASLMAAVGRAYLGTGNFAKGCELLEQSLDIRRREMQPDELQIADNLQELGTLYCFTGRVVESEAILRENLKRRRAMLAESDEGVVAAKAQLALVLGMAARDIVEAERLFREVIDQRRQSLEPNDPRIGEALLGLAGVLLWATEDSAIHAFQRKAEAVPLVAEGLRIISAHDTTRDFGQAVADFQKTMLLVNVGNRSRAAEMGQQAYQNTKIAMGNDHPLTLFMLGHLAHGMFLIDRRQESRRLYDELFTFFQARGIPFMFPGGEWSAVSDFANLLRESGETEKLEPILRRVLAKQKELTKYRGRGGAAVLSWLVGILKENGKSMEAKDLVADYLAVSGVLEMPPEKCDPHQLLQLTIAAERVNEIDIAAALFDKRVPMIHPRPFDDSFDVVYVLKVLARSFAGLRRFDAAEGRCRQALAIQRTNKGENKANIVDTLIQLGAAVEAQHRPSEADRYFLEAIDSARSLALNDARQLHDFLIAAARWADTLSARNELASAEHVVTDAITVGHRIRGPDAEKDFWMLKAMLCQGRVLAKQGKADQAKSLFEQVILDMDSVAEKEPGHSLLADAQTELAKFRPDEVDPAK